MQSRVRDRVWPDPCCGEPLLWGTLLWETLLSGTPALGNPALGNPALGEPLLRPAPSLYIELPGSAGSLRGAGPPLPSPATLDSPQLPGTLTSCLFPCSAGPPTASFHQISPAVPFCSVGSGTPPSALGLCSRAPARAAHLRTSLGHQASSPSPNLSGSDPCLLRPIQNHLQGWANSQAPMPAFSLSWTHGQSQQLSRRQEGEPLVTDRLKRGSSALVWAPAESSLWAVPAAGGCRGHRREGKT